MQYMVIYIENMNDVVISDTQQMINSMASTNFIGKDKMKPVVEGKLYHPVNNYSKIIEIDYLDMYIKVINEYDSTFIGQIIEGLHDMINLPAQIYIESYKKENESYYLYAKYS
jgi:hypothetical protein